MTEYLRLTEAPMWVVQYPTCSTCGVDLDTDGDAWTCPSCGTMWDRNANDGDVGELYESWSGERLHDKPLSPNEAWPIAMDRERVARKAEVDRIMAKYSTSVPS